MNSKDNFTPNSYLEQYCHNPNLGLATKERVGKVAGQERSPGVTPHAPESVGKCEGMNPSHFQGSFHFGNWSFCGLLNLQKAIAGVKTQWIKEFLISFKISWNLHV
jgi:hypothetical protein